MSVQLYLKILLYMYVRHVQWLIQASIECFDKQKINLPSTNYTLFFKHLTANCESTDTAYINWKCKADRKNLCDSIKSKWQGIKQKVLTKNDTKTTLKMQHFVVVERKIEKG